MRFIFIDEVTSISNDSITGNKYVSLNEDIFRDHFPEQPVLPAALLTESIIQLSRIFTWMNSEYQYSLIPIKFERLKFLRMVGPANIIKVELSFNPTDNEDNVKVKAKIKSGETDLVSEGSIVFQKVNFASIHRIEACKSLVGILTKNL
ncbi:3-hydroxyacyl-ACP dehydratase FabZ family protein [Paenibacillus sp. sgz500958]|uniref:3-hydroxyacyl-ACP dehydratase FabZ family protein n=1 Tax=Paenibacillus sp. sgz500958 TaxID=3242475 RepID=UPI0036D37B3C